MYASLFTYLSTKKIWSGVLSDSESSYDIVPGSTAATYFAYGLNISTNCCLISAELNVIVIAKKKAALCLDSLILLVDSSCFLLEPLMNWSLMINPAKIPMLKVTKASKTFISINDHQNQRAALLQISVVSICNFFWCRAKYFHPIILGDFDRFFCPTSRLAHLSSWTVRNSIQYCSAVSYITSILHICWNVCEGTARCSHENFKK